MDKLIVKLSPNQWIEVKHKGKIYLVAITSLLKAYTTQKEKNG